MSNQADFVIKQALKPLMNLTRPLSEEAAILYCEKLRRFSLDKVKSAVDRIAETWDKSTFPPLAVFLKELVPIPLTSSFERKAKLPWEERNEKRQKAIKEWRDEFIISGLYKTAYQENWSSRLYHYVSSIAWIQAQIIFPDVHGNIGWDHYAIEGGKDINQVIAEQRLICSHGQIDITIPNDLIDIWKAWTKLENQEAVVA